MTGTGCRRPPSEGEPPHIDRKIEAVDIGPLPMSKEEASQREVSKNE
jgi:hypothetical protein